MYVEQLDGCSVYDPTLVDDGNQHAFISSIADFEDHIRLTYYPERMQWSDEFEAVWDWMVDDQADSLQRAFTLKDNRFNQVGIACNCHKAFGQFCVVELGKNVTPLESFPFNLEAAAWPEGLGIDEPNGIFPGINQNYTHPLFENRDRDLQSLDLPGWLPEGFVFPNWWNSYSEQYWDISNMNKALIDWTYIGNNL